MFKNHSPTRAGLTSQTAKQVQKLAARPVLSRVSKTPPLTRLALVCEFEEKRQGLTSNLGLKLAPSPPGADEQSLPETSTPPSPPVKSGVILPGRGKREGAVLVPNTPSVAQADNKIFGVVEPGQSANRGGEQTMRKQVECRARVHKDCPVWRLPFLRTCV